MINYIGNKSSLSDFILPHCPKNPEYWIEPFGGAAGLYFTLNLKEYPDTKFIYNDVNPLNCNLFEQFKKEKFIQKVLSTKVSEDFYLECFDKLIMIIFILKNLSTRREAVESAAAASL